MTKNDYEIIARAIRTLPDVFDTNWDGEKTLRETVVQWMIANLSEKPRFNTKTFDNACLYYYRMGLR